MTSITVVGHDERVGVGDNALVVVVKGKKL